MEANVSGPVEEKVDGQFSNQWICASMRKIAWIVAAVVMVNMSVLGGFPARGAATDTGLGHVTGVAVDADGKGVAGVSVTIHAAGADAKALVSGTTDDKGSFTLDVAAPATDLVVDLKQDVKPFPTSATKTGVSVDPDKTTDVGKIEMKIQFN
jgi:hypothetical protein